MDYKEFAKQLRNQAGNYALFYGAPRGDLEKAADVIEELAAKLEPSSTPLTLDELREMDGEPVWVEIPEDRVTEWYQTETFIDDKLNETTVNHITVLDGVLLIASKAANVRATGLEGADAVNLYIPFDVKAVDGVTGENKKYVDPVEEWKTEKDKSGIWTISIGTVFVKDRVVLPDATRTVLELGYDDVYQVTKVDKLDFGGIPHFEVGGN